MTATRPNILVLIADQWSATSADGFQSDPHGAATPTLARLASEGTSFRAAYSAFPVCTPARASLFSGNYPCHTRVVGNMPDKAPGEITPIELPRLGDRLRDAGYDTGYFGKTHAAGLTTGFDDLGEYTYAGPGYLACGGIWDPLFTRDAIRFVEKSRSRPFAAVVSLVNPHDICRIPVQQPPIPFEDTSCADLTDRFNWSDAFTRGRDIPPVPANHTAPPLDFMPPTHGTSPDWGEKRWRRFLAVYQQLIENVDWQFGLVLDALERSGQADDTLVVFTTDHGDHAAAHGMVGKGTFYEESARVPLTLRFPGRIAAGRRDESHPVSHIDLLPSLLGLADIPVEGPCDGLDLTPLLEETPGPWNRDAIISETVDGRMVRFGQWKYICWAGREALFDLAQDPLETRNRIDDSGARSARETGRAHLEAHFAATGSNGTTNQQSQS